VQRHLEDALAKRVLAGEFMPGDVIHVDRDAEGLTFSRRPRDAARTGRAPDANLN
jgi:hypothetical protein